MAPAIRSLPRDPMGRSGDDPMNDPMDLHVDLGGLASLSLRGAGPALVREVARAFDPYALPGRRETADVMVEADPAMHGEAYRERLGDAGDGRSTASDGQRLYLLEGGRACGLPEPGAQPPVRIRVEPGFPARAMLGPVVRPLLQHATLDHGAATVHASTVEIEGGALMLAGWSETGKTEIALAFLEQGARFVSDKWTILDPSSGAHPFPAPVSIRRWVLPFVPRLRASLPPSARGQFLAAGVASGLLRPTRRLRVGTPAADLAVKGLGRSVDLVERRSIRPSELRAAYGQSSAPGPIPIRAVVLLTTVAEDRIVGQDADPVQTARRLTRSATFERRAYWELAARASYALADGRLGEGEIPSPEEQAAQIRRREESLLVPLLDRVRLIEVRVPFPTDPRPVADAIAGWI